VDRTSVASSIWWPTTGAVKQHAARRLAETRKATAKRYAPRPGKPEDD